MALNDRKFLNQQLNLIMEEFRVQLEKYKIEKIEDKKSGLVIARFFCSVFVP